jgi:chromosomal replication initiation ATPase DnaA
LGRKSYERFIRENAGMEDPTTDCFKGLALGSVGFVERILEEVKRSGPEWGPARLRETAAYDVETILSAVAKSFSVEKSEIFRKRRGNVHRQLALYFLKRQTGLSLKEIGRLFQMDYTAVSQACRRFDERLERDRKALEMKERLEKALQGPRIRIV